MERPHPHAVEHGADEFIAGREVHEHGRDRHSRFLENYFDMHPDREKAVEEMHRFADVGEQIILGAFTEATVIEPVSILLGDSATL